MSLLQKLSASLICINSNLIMNKTRLLCILLVIIFPIFIYSCSSNTGGGGNVVAPIVTDSPTPTVTVSPTTSPSPTPEPSPTDSATASPTPSASETASPAPTESASPSPTATASSSPAPTATATPIVVGTPESLTASDGNWLDKVAITWEAVSGATSYKVYRSTTIGGTYTLVDSTSEAIFNDTTAIAGTDYYYKVSALITATEGDKSTADLGVRSSGIVYVSQNAGNDSNNGVASSKAFSTINNAITFMGTGNNHTLRVASGEYSSNINYIYDSLGISSLVSFEGGYSNDFSSRSTDRISYLTTLNLGSNYCHVTRGSGLAKLKIEGFLFLASLTGASNQAKYAVQLKDNNSGSLFNFCNNTVSVEATGNIAAVGLELEFLDSPGSDVNRVSNNIINVNSGANCGAYGISKLDSGGSTIGEISNTIIEQNIINVVSGYTYCYGISGVGGLISLSSCVVKNNVITAKNNYSSSTAYAVDIFAQNFNVQILNNTLVAKSYSTGKTYNVWIKTLYATSENSIAIENNILYPINGDAAYRMGLYINTASGYYPPATLKNNLFLNSLLQNSAFPFTSYATADDINAYSPGYSGNLVAGDVSGNIFNAKDDTNLNLGDYTITDHADSGTYVKDRGLYLSGAVDVDKTGATRQNPPEIGAYEKN